MEGYKTIAFSVLKILMAVAMRYGYADFTPDPTIQAFIANVGSVLVLVEAVISIALRWKTKTPVFTSAAK